MGYGKVQVSNSEIRNPKHEIRNKSEIQISNVQNIFRSNTIWILIFGLKYNLRVQAHGLFDHFVLNFMLWSFEFVSDFDIRYSDLSKYID